MMDDLAFLGGLKEKKCTQCKQIKLIDRTIEEGEDICLRCKDQPRVARKKQIDLERQRKKRKECQKNY